MKTSKLVNFLTIMVLLFAAGCSLFDKPEGKSVADWGESDDPIPKVTEEIHKEYHVTYSTTPTDSSYWFVQLEFIREGGGKTTIHSAVALPMPYFDFYEARQKYDREGECYFEYFQQITKEGYESFYKYAGENK